MDNSDLIKKLKDQVASGTRDSYTEHLISMAHAVISRNESSQEQQKELVSLLEEVAKLKHPSPSRFLGGSAAPL